MYENIIAIHNVLKKKNYIVKFSITLIFKKKISKDNFEKKKRKEEEVNFEQKTKKITCKKKQKKKISYSEFPTCFRVF